MKDRRRVRGVYQELQRITKKMALRGLQSAFRPGLGLSLIAVSMLASLPGCLLIDGTDGAAGPAVRFRATEDVYEPNVITGVAVFMNFDIAARLENTGDEDVTLIGCFSPQKPVLEKFDNGEWISVYSVAEPLCLGPPYILKPGEVFMDTLVVSTVLNPDVLPEAKWESGPAVDGTYRLERPIYRSTSDESAGELLPLEDRLSQPFEIHPHIVPAN